MWSYTFEVPILMILAIILAFYFSRPRLSLKRNITFVHLIIAETVTIIIDVMASAADNDYASYSITFLKVINMLYFMAFFDRAYIMYIFSASVMQDTLQRDALVKHIIRIPLYAGIIVSIFSATHGSAEFPHLIFYIDENGYHSGNLYNLVYLCGFYYVFVALISMFLFRKSVGRRREKYALLCYNLIVMEALIFRLTLPKMLIMDTFILMAILVVFLAFGNPEYFIDLRGTVFNRVALSEHLKENHGSLKMRPIGVVVRLFNEMNDIYGASQMEEGMALIGKYLRQTYKKSVVFYVRRGRFVVLIRPDEDVEEKIEEIRKRFLHPWKSQTTELYLSVGFVTYEVVNTYYTADIMMSTMMKSLDTVGGSGSGETLYVTEANLQQAEEEKWVRNCIETVIDGTGFELYLQPIIDAATGEVVCAEALSRIRDSEGKIIPPGIFIPVAEGSGRINELGELVFEETCKFIKESNDSGLGIKWINVNLSPAQFIRTDLAERYASIVESYGISPGQVRLEITEGAMVDDTFLQQQIDYLTEKGFKLVLDDYGTGYSNLARLKKYPFTSIKLDMSIVWAYCKEPDEILPNMVQNFKHMGFTITAEGIEDQVMVNAMTAVGCDYLQGYHYSKPIPANEFANKYKK